MIAAVDSIQRPADAKLLVIDSHGHIEHRVRSEFVKLLRTGDVVVANDTATFTGEPLRKAQPERPRH